MDDPRLDPLWARAGELNVPVLIHTADPVAFFLPLDASNERRDELRLHSDWHFAGPEFPNHDTLLAQRNRVMERHPRTIFVGAHLGNYPEDLTYVDACLDRYPNFCVDTSARIGEMGRHPAEQVQAFLLKHQDRVIFGTDLTIGWDAAHEQQDPAEIEQFYDALIQAYEADNPNVDITLETFEYDLYIQTLQTAMPAGEEADILQLFGTWTSEYAERLAPVPEDVISVAEAEEIFYAAPIGGFVVDGVLYGLPQEFNLEYGGVLVNKSKYEAAGLTFPPAWTTREDMLKDAQALVEVDDAGVMNVAGYHFTASDPVAFDFLAGIRQRGGDYWNADQTAFTFNTPEAKATLEWMLSAVDEWKVVDPVLFNDEENWVGDAFFEGRVGLGYIGTWAIAEGRVGYPDFEDEWDYAWLPSHEGDPVFVADSGWGLVVSPNSEHQDVAWDLVKFAAANAGNALPWNLASGTIPAIPEVAQSDEIAAEMPWVAAALDLLPYGSYLGSMPDRDLVVYEIIYPHVLLALQGVETVDEALEAIDAEANATFE